MINRPTSYKWVWVLGIVIAASVLLGTGIMLYVSAKLQQNVANSSPNYTARELSARASDQIDKGDYVKAEQYLESALLKSDDSTYRNQLAVVKYRLKKYSESAYQYQLLINKKKDLAFAWNGLGNVYRDWSEQTGVPVSDYQKKAQDAYKQSYTLDPQYISAYSNLALMLNSMGDKVGALNILDQGIAATKSTELQKVRDLLAKN